MGYKPNEGKGIEVEPDVLLYEQTDASGNIHYARCLGWTNDKVKGLRHAWVLHPSFGTEQMTPEEGRLSGFKPIRVVLREKYDADMAAMEARIAKLEAFVADVAAARAAKGKA